LGNGAGEFVSMGQLRVVAGTGDGRERDTRAERVQQGMRLVGERILGAPYHMDWAGMARERGAQLSTPFLGGGRSEQLCGGGRDTSTA
jgi:hypothetical protein